MNIALPKIRMKVPDFLAWAQAQPAGRFELVDGEIVMMSPERVRHNLIKLEVAIALREAVRSAGLPCVVFTDGLTVVINDSTAREPDASVQCDGKLDLDSLTVDAPVIVVEVASPSSDRNDANVKLVEYFSVASIQHYLIVMPEQRAVVHHQRSGTGPIQTRILHEGELDISPPGMRVAVAGLLGPAGETRDGGDKD